MSRKSIRLGDAASRRRPHGPHPGRTEQSLGQKETNELAVMVDTFHTLKVSRQAIGIEDPHYFQSWVETPASRLRLRTEPVKARYARCSTA